METENQANQKKRRLSVGLFIGGVLIGFVFNVLLVWANFEASLWNQRPNRDEALDGLRCPLVITRAETAQVTILYKNSLDRPINPVIRTKISERLTSLQREEETRPDIEPGDTARIEYSVSGENAVWNRFLLVRVNTLPQFSLPSRTGACGILVVNIPFLRGWTITGLVVLLSLGGMGVGIWQWRSMHSRMLGRVKFAYQAMIYLAVLVTAGFALAFLSLWWLATLLVFITFVLITTVLAYFLASP
jgi:hypothetical protein